MNPKYIIEVVKSSSQILYLSDFTYVEDNCFFWCCDKNDAFLLEYNVAKNLLVKLKENTLEPGESISIKEVLVKEENGYVLQAANGEYLVCIINLEDKNLMVYPTTSNIVNAYIYSIKDFKVNPNLWKAVCDGTFSVYEVSTFVKKFVDWHTKTESELNRFAFQSCTDCNK